MNEIWNILLTAKDACIKIKSSQKITNSELESLFIIYWYDKKEKNEDDETCSSSVFKTIIDSVNFIVDKVILQLLADDLKNWGSSFVDILAEDILNGWTTLKSILDNPSSFLKNKINDENAKETLNNLLKGKIEEELNKPDSSNFESLNIQDLQNVLSKIDSLDYLEQDTKDSIKTCISTAIYWKVAPELENISGNFIKDVTEAIKNWNYDFDAKGYKDKFNNTVTEIENNKIVRWTSAEELLQQCRTTFETEFDENVLKLIDALIWWKLLDELDIFENEADIDKYTESWDTAYSGIIRLLDIIEKEETKSEYLNKLNKVIKWIRLICKSKPPQVKTITDESWNKYAIFKTEDFPVLHREPQKSVWKIEPKKLSNGNILITFKDLTSGKVIEPSVSKSLRFENPYEVSVDEWKELDKQIKGSQKLLKEITTLKWEIEKTWDEWKKLELQKKIAEYAEKTPFYLKIRDKLKFFDQFIWDYIQDKVPNFDAATTKITPDIMENLREMAECSKTMLLGQKDALIIEWEAWVWKNVLIDIFAHFTNRPVFVFACGKKTDGHDLTYQWILDENGSKKLNSKIYEAIHTPWAILVLDEINTLDAWVIKMLNGLFDKRKTLVSPEAWARDAKALPDVLLFGTMNPVGYGWTQQLPQDVDSRFHHIIHDYDRLFTEEGWVSYSDALRTYWNVNYFWKIASWNWMKKEEVELYEQALLDKKMWNKLSKNKQEILKRFKPISDADFIWAWNQLFIIWNEKKVVDEFWLTFVEGMKDIYTIVLFSNYIRMRHRFSQFGIESNSLPRDENTNDLFEEKSFSPRLEIQSLEQLNNWNEISSAKQAVIQTYVQQVSDVKKRTKIVQFFNTMTNETLEESLKDEEVQKLLFAHKSS